MIPLGKNRVSCDYGGEDVYKGEMHRLGLLIVVLVNLVVQENCKLQLGAGACPDGSIVKLELAPVLGNGRKEKTRWCRVTKWKKRHDLRAQYESDEWRAVSMAGKT